MTMTEQRQVLHHEFLLAWKEVFGPTTWFTGPGRPDFAQFYEAWRTTGVDPIRWILENAFPERAEGSSLTSQPALNLAMGFVLSVDCDPTIGDSPSTDAPSGWAQPTLPLSSWSGNG